MSLLKQIIIGIIIGGGMILPGVSGGVLAVIFGIYEKMINAIASFSKDVRQNLTFLTPLIIGIIIGVFLFGKILFFVFKYYPKEASYAFIGLILGSIPILFKEITIKHQGKIRILVFLFSFILSITLFILGKNLLNINLSSHLDNGIKSFVFLFLTGLIYIMGKIIPGISSSFLLMLIGMYQFFLTFINNILILNINDYLSLAPFFLGIIIGSIYLIKVIQYLLQEHFSVTYSIIIGFIIGSIPTIYPGFSFDLTGLVCVILMLLGFYISYKSALIS